LAKILGLEIRSPKNLKTIAAQLVYDTKTGQPKAIWFSPKASEIEKLHEIGHAIDFKNKLTQKFIENREVIPQKEFKDIIELFIERSPNRIKYAFDTKEHMAQIIGSFLENPKDFVSKRPELTKFLLKESRELADFYNQAVKGTKEAKPERAVEEAPVEEKVETPGFDKEIEIADRIESMALYIVYNKSTELNKLPQDIQDYIYGIADVGLDESLKQGRIQKAEQKFNKTLKNYPELTKGIKEVEPEVKPVEEVKPVPKIAPEAPESPTRGGLPERGIKQPPKPKEGAKPKKSLPKEEKLEVVSNVTVGDKLDVDIEQDIKDQPVTVVKEDGSEETLEIPTEPVEIYNSEWRKVKTTDPIAIMRWNEIKKNLDDLLTTFKQAIPDLKELKATQKELVSSLRDIQLAKLDEIFAEAKDINEFQQRLGELSETAGKSVSEKVQKLFDGETLNKAFSIIQYFSGNDWLKLSALKAFLDLSTGHTAYASGYQQLLKSLDLNFPYKLNNSFL